MQCNKKKETRTQLNDDGRDGRRKKNTKLRLYRFFFQFEHIIIYIDITKDRGIIFPSSSGFLHLEEEQ